MIRNNDNNTINDNTNNNNNNYNTSQIISICNFSYVVEKNNVYDLIGKLYAVVHLYKKIHHFVYFIFHAPAYILTDPRVARS